MDAPNRHILLQYKWYSNDDLGCLSTCAGLWNAPLQCLCALHATFLWLRFRDLDSGLDPLPHA